MESGFTTYYDACMHIIVGIYSLDRLPHTKVMSTSTSTSKILEPLGTRRHSGGATPTISPKTRYVGRDLCESREQISDAIDDVNSSCYLKQKHCTVKQYLINAL